MHTIHRVSECPLDAGLNQTPFPQGWVLWDGIEPTFRRADPGFPVAGYLSARNAGTRYPLCLIGSASPVGEAIDAACVLRRLDPEIEIVVGLPAAGPHPEDLDRAVAERLLLVNLNCERAVLGHNIRVLLSNHARYQAPHCRSAHDFSQILASGSDNAALIDAADIMLMVMDKQGRIIHVNAGVCRRLGYSAHELCGRLAVDFHPEPFRGEAMEIVAATLAGQVDKCTLPLLARSGEWVSVETKVVPGRWRGREVYLAATKDLTELTAFQSHFQTVFQHAGLGMAIIRTDDRVYLDANREFEHRLGFSREAVIGKQLGTLGPVANSEVIHPLIDEVVAGRPVLDRELPILSSTGERMIMLVSATPVSKDGQGCILLAARDITERHKASSRVASTLTTALEAGAEGIAITDAEGEFTYMNPAHASLFGYHDPGELIGSSWRVLYRSPEVARIEGDVIPVLTSRGFWRGRLPGKRKDGTTVFQEVRLTLTPEHGIVCFTNDATEIAQGLRQRERLLCHTHSLWVICDLGGKAVQFNDAWVALLGVSREDIRAKTVFDFVHPEDIAATRRQFKSLRKNEAVASFVVRMNGSDGQVYWLDWCAIASPEDRLVYATAHDITRTRQAEQSLMDNIASIKSLAEMKASFLATASHELRTPLANIALGTGLIRHHGAALGEEERTGILEGIAEGVGHMNRLLDNLLVSTRLQQFHMSVKAGMIDLAAFVEVTLSRLEASHRLRVVRSFRLDTPVAVLDQSLLEHILTNLLSNACKYSPGSEPVELDTQLAGGRLRIAVRDCGIGIPVDQIARVFDGFFRGRNVGQIQGTGLGLFIVRQCVTLLGGEVSCSNRETGGVEFVVRLPTLPVERVQDAAARMEAVISHRAQEPPLP